MRTALVLVWLAACATGQKTPSVKHEMFSQPEAYERFMGRWSHLVALQLIQLAEIHDGDAILDVGSGTGALSFVIRDTTKAGRIVGVDPSSEYVEFATKRADARTHFEVGDGQDLHLSSAGFDRTFALLVLNFIPDSERAAREMVRVTKPGGVVVAAVWDYSQGMEMLRVFWDEADALDPAMASTDEAHMPLTHQGDLAALWTKAGLLHVEETPLVIEQHFASFDDYWTPFLLGVGPAGTYVGKLSSERQAALQERLRRRLLGDGPDRAIVLHARAWAVKGIVPQTANP
jgi:ubiquinone/menaquinone biosynthesis C-methylase UbiE